MSACVPITNVWEKGGEKRLLSVRRIAGLFRPVSDAVSPPRMMDNAGDLTGVTWMNRFAKIASFKSTCKADIHLLFFARLPMCVTANDCRVRSHLWPVSSVH